MGALAAGDSTRDPIALARRDAVLRFAVGMALAFVIAEAMGWFPTFLAPVLLAVLLTSLPNAPPLKVGVVLVAVMAAAAAVAFVLPALLRGTPWVLFGVVSLIVLLAFAAMANQRVKLPATLLLLCISVIPVLVMVAPAQAGFMPVAMIRAMAVAMLILWLMYALWPRVVPRPAPPASAPLESPVKMALTGTAIVLPMMLVYLMFGLSDALPVLVTVVLLVVNFDLQRGAMQGLAMMIGNLIGGLTAVVVFMMLGIAPSLVVLALLTFLVSTAFALRIEKGGPAGAVAVLMSNSFMIILSSAIASGPANSGILLTRLFQFALACAFAIGMMSLVWGKKTRPTPSGQAARSADRRSAGNTR